MIRRVVSKQTRNNYLIDIALLLGAVFSSLTGVYFLYFPVGGYQGGRNPSYGITFLFNRGTWDDLHTWFGILMIISAIVHVMVHWNWIIKMTRRVFEELIGRCRQFNSRSRYNVMLNIGIGLSFILTAVSGVFLLLVEGGRRGMADPAFIFPRITWDSIHTWAGIALILFGLLHFAIHWGWVKKVTGKMIKTLETHSGVDAGNLPIKQPILDEE